MPNSFADCCESPDVLEVQVLIRTDLEGIEQSFVFHTTFHAMALTHPVGVSRRLFPSTNLRVFDDYILDLMAKKLGINAVANPLYWTLVIARRPSLHIEHGESWSGIGLCPISKGPSKKINSSRLLISWLWKKHRSHISYLLHHRS